MRKSFLVVIVLTIGIFISTSCTTHRGCPGMQAGKQINKTEKPV